MQLKFGIVYWNGAMEYTVPIPKDATVIDCFCVNDNLRIPYLCKSPHLDMKDRKFKVLGDWQDGIDLGDELAYVGTVQWSALMTTKNMKISFPDGSMQEVPLSNPSEKFFPEVETYVVFEVLNG